jgi:hypothetical protein
MVRGLVLGLAVATIICLLIIPCLQAIFDDVAQMLRQGRHDSVPAP